MEALRSEDMDPDKKEITTLNVFCLGKGPVGSNLVDQILDTGFEVELRRKVRVKVFGVADSRYYIFDKSGVTGNWRAELASGKHRNDLDEIVQRICELDLENVVIADNTASQEVTDRYPDFLKEGFNIVASNKKLNSGPYEKYHQIRALLDKKGKLFYYEANVGAGLPVIDTIKQLKDAGDSITRIRGIFSGSLSYLFNTFSDTDRSFSDVLLEARKKGLTEADPREDLSGLDVARKLIILSREIGLKSNLEDVKVQNLIPEALRDKINLNSFLKEREVLDDHYKAIQQNLKEKKVLRYVGDLDVELRELKVSLIEVSRDSLMGNIKGTDSIFELNTKDYGEQPIVIQGAGAGGKVTARGVYSDLVRIGRASL